MYIRLKSFFSPQDLFYREERTTSIWKPDGDIEEEKNKMLHKLAKKICVINKWLRNSSVVFEEISSTSLKCSQDKVGKFILVAFSCSSCEDIEKNTRHGSCMASTGSLPYFSWDLSNFYHQLGR